MPISDTNLFPKRKFLKKKKKIEIRYVFQKCPRLFLRKCIFKKRNILKSISSILILEFRINKLEKLSFSSVRMSIWLRELLCFVIKIHSSLVSCAAFTYFLLYLFLHCLSNFPLKSKCLNAYKQMTLN